MANKLVNTLTLQIAEKDQEIIDLKSQLEKMGRDDAKRLNSGGNK